MTRVGNLDFVRPYAGKDRPSTLDHDAIATALRRLLPQWARGSALLEDIDFTSGSVSYVEHKLGYPHKGYFIVRQRGTAGVLTELATTDASYASSLEATHLQLNPSATFTASLVVF